jgi:hypothetical protein
MICDLCGQTLKETPHKTNPTKKLYSHKDLKACTKRKPLKDPTPCKKHTNGYTPNSN